MLNAILFFSELWVNSSYKNHVYNFYIGLYKWLLLVSEDYNNFTKNITFKYVNAYDVSAYFKLQSGMQVKF